MTLVPRVVHAGRGLLPGEEQVSDPLTAFLLCPQVPGCLEATAFTKHPRFWWKR